MSFYVEFRAFSLNNIFKKSNQINKMSIKNE